MIIADISVVPIGTCSTSVSDYVAKAETVLKGFPNLEYELTSMSTQISGQDIEEIFDALKKMHLEVINSGAMRAYTNIKIDDRRDKDNTMEDKIKSVIEKM